MQGKTLSLYLFTAIVILFTVVSKVYAISPSAIGVDVAPANPTPYSNVTITLSSFTANLDSVNITWLVDGGVALSGVGVKSFSMTAKGANTETRVEARIFLPDGEIDKKIIIKPAVMVLLWQATDSYVPPFYKGKALPTAESEIKIVAMPEITVGGAMINPKNMTYAWKKDYNNMQTDSGYGKNFFTYINDYLENANMVSVVASTTDGKYESESSVNVGVNTPLISFYKKDLSLGTMWEQSLSDGHLIQGEEMIIAEPYFISPKEWRRPDLLFYWSINDRSVNVPSYRKNIMPLKAEVGTSGTSKLKLEIENTDKIFQTAKKEININF